MNLKQNLSLIRRMGTGSFSFCYQKLMLLQPAFSFDLSCHYDHSQVRQKSFGVHVLGACDHLYDGFSYDVEVCQSLERVSVMSCDRGSDYCFYYDFVTFSSNQ